MSLLDSQNLCFLEIEWQFQPHVHLVLHKPVSGVYFSRESCCVRGIDFAKNQTHKHQKPGPSAFPVFFYCWTLNTLGRRLLHYSLHGLFSFFHLHLGSSSHHPSRSIINF